MSEVAVRDDRTPAQILTAQVRSDEFKEQVAMAIPENMPPSRFVRATVTALIQNPALAEVDRDSFFGSILKCAQDGLLPDGREAAIVPYKGKAQYLPMIGGYRKIAGEHGWTIETYVVHEADEFNYELGLDPKVIHRPAPVKSDRGPLVAAYAIGRHRDGRSVVEVYEASAVQAAKGVAQTDRVWKQWPTQMWEKTVGKRLFQKLPLDPSDKRVAGLATIDAEEIGPEGSARMLYGPGGATFRDVTPEIGAGTEGTGGASTGPETAVDASAAEAVSSLPDQQAAAGADPDEFPGAPAAAPGFPIPDDVVDAAGRTVVQDEWTVAAVCADGKGREWVQWLLGPGYDDSVDPKIVDAVRLYVGQRHPEMLP